MKVLLAKKVNMTQVFGEDGAVQPATVLSVEPVVVSQVRTKEKDGYYAVQVAFGKTREKNLSKPVRGHLKDLGNPLTLKEFRVTEASALNRGDKISIDIF